jgi:CubicO group peptidase (beta-lactamase class C family)
VSPHSQWAFAHAEDVLPTAPIACDPSDIQALPVALQCLDHVQLTQRNGGKMPLQDFLTSTATDAFVVVQNGKIIFEFYDHGMTAQTPHILMSVTKSFTGLVAGMLADQGVLNLELTVADYLPELCRTAWQDVPLQALLDMRSGVALDAAQVEGYTLASGWAPKSETPADLHGFFQGLVDPGAPPWGAFRYVSANTDLMGWVIERASGERFADLVSRLIWKPIGAEQPGYITTDDLGAPRCTGGLGGTARDLARLGRVLAQGGVRGGQQIIPARWLEDTQTRGDAQAWREGEFAPGFTGMDIRYRNGWYGVEDSPRHMFAMGVYGQNLFVDAANDLVIVKFSSLAQPVDIRAIWLTHLAVSQITASLTGA